MKPIFWLRRRERASSLSPRTSCPSRQKCPSGEGLQQAGDVEEGGLAGTRRTGDGDELAFADMQVERAQRMRFDEFGAVDLGDLAHVEHGDVLRG
jgi:hypothetical protein